MKSFHIITFGCQMNEHDSERMSGILEAQGYLQTPDPASADMVILNTCSIREKAEQKFYSELGRLRNLKQENAGLTIAVAGCIAQQEKQGIFDRAPYVDLVFGPSDIGRLSSLVERELSKTEPTIATDGDPDYHNTLLPTKRGDRIKAWVSIMYGCNNFCTYCVVPYLRGRERSRPAADIEAEVRELAASGYKEVTLLGQNVNSYGRGLDEKVDFPGLLERLQESNGLERIRFVTSHPRDLSDRLISAMRDLPKVCEALHLPVQSGSNVILDAMNRRYSREEYLEKIARLRDAVPGIALTSDIIVGFPGESEKDFRDTMDLLSKVRYDGLFAFKYSKRPGTAAIEFDNHLPEQIKEERLDLVLTMQRDISTGKQRSLIGTVQQVLIDGVSKKGGTVAGRTRTNKVVNVEAPASSIGALVNVVITSAGQNSLSGTICE